ncbi:TetR/AcrR family transcriptional regulator [Streptomyces sp. NPDC098789]|uniref:TetR/AcrR family transcriptional regulator n=1 Tax=Streptomyces sp. NPDC098789 TaxID=3366098 RepID=UPI00382D7B54
MSTRPSTRPGGRSARVQQSVHDAARDLVAERGREGLTVPMIAARAGVTPSTVYRRWGDLQELLADVAVAHLRPDGPPDDRGSLRDDLDAWAELFLDEMASPPGRAYVRDVLSGDPDGLGAGQCSAYAAEQLTVILERAVERGEVAPGLEDTMDAVVAPMVYRILFRPGALTADYARGLVDALLAR